MINITHFETSDAFILLKQEWNTLLKQSSVDDAFLTWEWLSTWWKHYGHAYVLCLLTAREEERLVGIAPLMLEKQKVLGMTVSVIRNIGTPPPDVAGWIIENGRVEVLVCFADWLIDNHQCWDVLIVREIPPGGMDFARLKSQFPMKRFVFEMDTTRHFLIDMRLGWEDYYQTLSKSLRRDLRKKIRHLQERGGYQFTRKVGREATFDIETVFRINQNARHVYLYRDQIEQDFHRELARIMAEHGWLDISLLYFENIPVAFRYGFCYNGVFEAWRTGFDTSYFRLSVGKVLLFFLIQDGFENGLKLIHFLRGDHDYKLDWKVNPHLFAHIQITRKTAKPLLTHVYFPRVKRRARSFLSEHQSLRPLLAWYERLVSPK